MVGVQAEGAAAFPESLRAGSPVPLESMTTMADGIAVGRPGDITFAAVQEHCDDIITVSEESLSRALLALVERAKMVVEPAGAAAVAAMLDDPTAFETPAVAVLSGGNIDPLLLEQGDPPRPRRPPGATSTSGSSSPTCRAAWPACCTRSARPAPTCSRSPTSGSRRP